jgi:CheY-like chemotaxis protein
MLIALEMPRLDGTFLIRKFRKEDDFAKTPIIALANNVDKPTLAKLNEFAIKDALTKPLEPEKVLAAVEKYYKLKVIAELMRED